MSKTKQINEKSVLKKMKDGNGKVAFDGPKVKDRKKFAPATKVEKPKKGKGSFNRKNAFDEDEEKKSCWKGYEKKGIKKKGHKKVHNCVEVKENTTIVKMLDSIFEKNYADAHKYLKDAINLKIQQRISKEIDTPIF
jgi:stalled ribosome alternative rescue factor ArfA